MQSVLAVQQEPLVQERNSVIVNSKKRNEEICKIKRNSKHWILNSCQSSVFANISTTVILVVTTWLSVAILCPRLNISSAGIIQLMSMIAASYLVGQVCLSCGLPQVLPMYIIGMVYRTYGLVDDWFINWAAFTNLRYLAITVVLVKGGLAMDLDAVKTYPIQVLKSSFLICTSEALALTVAASILLSNIFPPLWTFVFGFVNAATSPTKFATVLANLKRTKRYSNQKMQSIWSFSAPIEDIYCITVFSALMSMITSTSATETTALLLVIVCGKVALGFAAGTAWGIVVGYFPHKDDINSSVKRFTGLWLGVIAIYFGAKSYGWGPGGPLGTYVAGISASTVWALHKSDKKPVLDSFNKLWDWLMEPVLFTLTGFEIDMNHLPMSITDISFTIAALIIGYAARFCVTIVINYRARCNFKEIVFLAIAGLPKATVQAAIAPQLLDLLRGKEDQGRAASLLFGSIISCFLVTTIATLFLHYFSAMLLKSGDKPKQNHENHNAV